MTHPPSLILKTMDYVKLITRSRQHFTHTYTEGLNELKMPFNPTESCGPGALYVCKRRDIWKWVEEYPELAYIATVTLCPDSRVVHMEDKIKTDKMILGPFKTLAEYLLTEWQGDSQTAYLMYRVEEQTPELCEAVVAKCPWALQYIRKPAEDLVLRTIRREPNCIQCVKEQSLAACLLAVELKGTSLQYVRIQTLEVCRKAVEQNPAARQWVQKKWKLLV